MGSFIIKALVYSYTGTKVKGEYSCVAGCVVGGAVNIIEESDILLERVRREVDETDIRDALCKVNFVIISCRSPYANCGPDKKMSRLPGMV